MQKTQEQTSSRSAEKLYKFFIYLVLILLAVTIIVPVAWVFMASVKQNSEFYGNPWALPAGFYWQNFVDAWNGAKMGQYMLNSVLVTALALVLLLVIALPAAYCLSRFKFRGSKLLNTLFMAGLFINVNYIVVPIFLMLRDGDTWLKKPDRQHLPAEQPGGAGGGLRRDGSAFHHLPAVVVPPGGVAAAAAIGGQRALARHHGPGLRHRRVCPAGGLPLAAGPQAWTPGQAAGACHRALTPLGEQARARKTAKT